LITRAANVFKLLNATQMDQLDKKQIGRYMRYKLAFDRMDEALQEGWLLEAISLQESIISDRLASILDAKGETVSIKQSLGRLISHAKKVMTGSGAMPAVARADSKSVPESLAGAVSMG